MSGFGKRIDGPAGRRRTTRRQIGVLGSAVTIDGARSVIVADLCPKGARLVGRDLPPPGKDILLRTSDLSVLGRIAWARRDERGLVFEDQGAPSAGECLAVQLRAGAEI
jgi:hypothetical protein